MTLKWVDIDMLNTVDFNSEHWTHKHTDFIENYGIHDMNHEIAIQQLTIVL